jgi:hypothetical protein
MEPRIDRVKVAPGVIEAILGPTCERRRSRGAYCIDMHWKDLRAAGESEQRLYGLDAWEESPYYSDRERAALAWTEAVTRVPPGGEVLLGEGARRPDARGRAINAWNRLNIAGRTVPGAYRPARAHEAKRGA